MHGPLCTLYVVNLFLMSVKLFGHQWAVVKYYVTMYIVTSNYVNEMKIKLIQLSEVGISC